MKQCLLIVILFGISACAVMQQDDFKPEVKTALTVQPGECPDWSHDATINYDNSVMSNFGCATATNLSLMVANSGDLIAGRNKPENETNTTVRAIERYYKGEFIQQTPDYQPVTSE